MTTTPTTADELARLVAFPTVSDRPVTELAAHLARRAEDQGFRVERFDAGPDKTTVIASKGPAGTDGLVLSGHMDVVPADGQPWTSDPFRLTARDDRWVGRGTTDMKGFIAAAVVGLDALAGVRLDRELVLIWTHDEELGCVGSGRLVDQWDGRTLPTACWIGEPTDFRVMRMHPGHVRMYVEITGEAAHSSKPELGVNAIEIAADVVAVIRQLASDLRQRPHPGLPKGADTVPLLAARIHGGTAINIVPDHCRVDVGYRPVPGQRLEDVYDELEVRLHDALGARMARVHLHTTTLTPSLLTPSGTALARLFAPHASPGVDAAPFATDGGQLSRLGTQPLVFGPGSIEVAHKADEYVEMAALARTETLLRDLVLARCKDA